MAAKKRERNSKSDENHQLQVEDLRDLVPAEGINTEWEPPLGRVREQDDIWIRMGGGDSRGRRRSNDY